MKIERGVWPGFYIAFEGLNKSGKSSQAKALYGWLCDTPRFNDKVILTREPGGTIIAEAIRQTVQVKHWEEHMDSICEAYLYAASRGQSLRRVVAPAVEHGGIVITDRCVISSLVFQGCYRGLGLERVWNINREAVGGYIPDITFFINTSLETCMARKADVEGDKFERDLNLRMLETLQEGYIRCLAIAGLGMVEIDGNRPFGKVQEDVQFQVVKLINARSSV